MQQRVNFQTKIERNQRAASLNASAKALAEPAPDFARIRHNLGMQSPHQDMSKHVDSSAAGRDMESYRCELLAALPLSELKLYLLENPSEKLQITREAYTLQQDSKDSGLRENGINVQLQQRLQSGEPFVYEGSGSALTDAVVRSFATQVLLDAQSSGQPVADVFAKHLQDFPKFQHNEVPMLMVEATAYLLIQSGAPNAKQDIQSLLPFMAHDRY